MPVAQSFLPAAASNLAYAADRVWHALRPPVRITAPPAGVRFQRDVPVAMRDGVTLRVNVFRPIAAGRYPVILCAHPYGKDNLPRRTRAGYRLPLQFRLMRQTAPYSFSAWTSWEAPDPAFWATHGYVVVNADLRGFGHSDGEGTLFSDAESRDYYDLIEWAAAQPWSNGRIGLNGVSYLAISQWKVAALQPPHLAAICPWEGFSDAYRDFAYPGGVRADGFVPFWSKRVRKQGRCRDDLRREQLARPLRDAWWAAHAPALERIQTPALICGSFSDHCVHTRGSFAAFGRIGSAQRWLYTHRTGKWAAYYSPEALALQLQFFDHFLKGVENGMQDVPPVWLEVRETRDTIHAVRHEAAWPPPATRWTALALHPDGTLHDRPSPTEGVVSLAMPARRASFVWTIPHDLEVVGPLALRLWVECRGATDAHLFVGVRKFRGRREIAFEGSFGFNHDLVTRGWQRLALRQLDPARSTVWQPEHTDGDLQPLRPGEIVPVEIELLPSATFFRRGETLRLDVQGRTFFAHDPLLGQYPSTYQPSPSGTVLLHCGGDHDARLLVPVVAGS